VARILIVESHAEVRELLERVIARLCHEARRRSPGDLDLSAIDACLL
jgi:hypothetical protein